MAEQSRGGGEINRAVDMSTKAVTGAKITDTTGPSGPGGGLVDLEKELTCSVNFALIQFSLTYSSSSSLLYHMLTNVDMHRYSVSTTHPSRLSAYILRLLSC